MLAGCFPVIDLFSAEAEFASQQRAMTINSFGWNGFAGLSIETKSHQFPAGVIVRHLFLLKAISVRSGHDTLSENSEKP